MKVYFYNADIYCEDCGNDIKRRIRKELKASGSKDSPVSQDSNEWPQPAEDGGGESDCPQHCGAGSDCYNADDYGRTGVKVGLFLENPLTRDGEAYVKEMHKDRPSEITQMWMDHYGLEADSDDDEPTECDHVADEEIQNSGSDESLATEV